MLKLTENIEIEIINLILPVIYILIGMVIYKVLKRIINRSICTKKANTYLSFSVLVCTLINRY